MQNVMVVRSGNVRASHTCPCKGCKGDNEIIPTFYSEQHASDKGWKKTRHIKFCEQGKTYAWVCPSCAAAFDWAKG